MKVKDYINERLICIDLKSSTKSEVIQELAGYLYREDKISEIAMFCEKIEERESIGSTGFGFKTAIPHAKSEWVNEPSIVFGRKNEGLDFDSLDQEKTYLFFMIATPPDNGENLHLKLLANLSQNLIFDTFRDALLEAKSVADVMEIFEQMV